MRKKRFTTGILTLLLVLSVTLCGMPLHANAMTVLDVPATPSATDCTILGVYGSYFSQAQEALDEINAIRKEACESGNVPDPRNPSRMLAPEDYSPLKWSRDLESIARIRAAEAAVCYSFLSSAHNRPNNTGFSSISYNGVSSSSENLAFYTNTNMIEGITMWHLEKRYWTAQDDSQHETRHYTTLINPKYTYIGLGGFETTAGRYPDTLAAELSSADGLDETMQAAPSDVMQKIEVSNQYTSEAVLEGTTSLDTDTTTTLTPKVKLVNYYATRYLWALGSFTFTSSNPQVATVSDNGVVTALKGGTTTITASLNGIMQSSAVVTVTCTHTRTMTSYTPPTCSTTGSKSLYCDICNDTITESIPTTAHDYVYGSADAGGKCTGVCSVCGNTICIIPPTDFTVSWKNNKYTATGFSETFPNDNPTGSILYCYPQVTNGDSNYQDLVIETSDPSVLSVPDTFENISINELKVLKYGTVTLTIYPKYNARLKKTFTVTVGDYERPAVANITQNGLTYTIRENADGSRSAYVSAASGVTLTGKIKIPHSITISDTSYDVTTLDTNAFAGQSQITAFQFPNTLTKIQSGAFTNCTGLADITFMSRIAPYVSDNVWSGVNGSALTLHVPSYSTNYDAIAESIDAKIVIEDSCAHILIYHERQEPTCTQYGCISYYECTECYKLFEDEACTKSISWSELKIEPLGHDWDTQFTIDFAPTSYSEGEKSIHCKRCSDRKDITEIPATNDASSNPSNVDDAPSIPSSNAPKVGDTFTKAGLRYKVVSASKSSGNYAVSCTGAVSKTKTSVKIPGTVTMGQQKYKVTQVGKKAFYKRTKLKSVTLGSNITEIGASAFYGCTSLKKIVIPKNTKRIGASAFYKCSSLKTVTINSRLLTKNSVGKQAFSKINKKASVNVPSTKRASYKKWFKSKGLNIK